MTGHTVLSSNVIRPDDWTHGIQCVDRIGEHRAIVGALNKFVSKLRYIVAF